MTNDYYRLMQSIGPKKAPKSLIQGVFVRIALEKKAEALKRFYGFSVAAIASFSSVITAIIMLIKSFTGSGISNYISLIFTDGFSFLAYWKEFGFFVLESLPMYTLILLFSGVLVLLWSLSKVTKQASVAFQTVT